MTYQIVQTQTVYDGWTTLYVTTVRGPQGKTVRREVEDHGSAVCVLPYDPARRTAVLVRQPRAPALYAAREQTTLEAIAGILEEDDPEACARRETKEEVGIALDALQHLVTAWTMPGISTERMHFYLAEYAGAPTLSKAGRAEEDEDIVPVEIALAELAAMADRGELSDMKTLLLLQTLRLRRPDLFTAT